MKTNRIIMLSMVLGIGLMAAGCTNRNGEFSHVLEQPNNTPPFGSSVRMAIQSQTLNPNPPSMEPVQGQDGKYTQSVLEKYQKGPENEKSGVSIMEMILK